MSLGLFVEGQSDKDTIPILIRKLGYASGIRTRVVPQGLMLLSRVFRDNGRRFVKTSHDRQIAERVTPAVIAARSPTFVAFIDALGLSPEVGRSGSR